MARSKSTLASQVRANTERQKRGAMNASYLSLPEGVPLIQVKEKCTLVLDFLPYKVTSNYHMDKDAKLGMAVKGSKWWKLPIRVHKGIGPNRQPIICPRSVSPKLKCPICEEYDAEREQGSSHDDVGHLWPSLRNLYVVYPRMKGYPKVPHIFDMSQHLCQRFINDEMENQEVYDFMDPKVGKTVSLRFSERKHNNYSFFEVSRIDFLERRKPIPKSVLAKVPKLDECLVVMSYDEILEIFHSSAPVENPDTQPSRKRSKKSKKPTKSKSRDVDWGDDDDDDDDAFDEDVEDAIFDEEDDEEADDDVEDFDDDDFDDDEDDDGDDFDDEDDEDDDEDDEEPEPPKRSKKSKKSKKRRR